MKSDLDQLMQKYNIDVVYVHGGEEPNMQRSYLMNGAHTSGVVIKKRGEAPVAIVGSMEVGEAAKSGLKIYTPFDFGLGDLRRKYGSNQEAVMRELIPAYFERLNLSGRVALFGTADVMVTAWLALEVWSLLPGVAIVRDFEAARLFEDAYATKDEHEILELKKAARLASDVMAATWDFIAEHSADEHGVVVDGKGIPLTIGAVKRYIQLKSFEHGLDNSHGLIFAQGRDAGIPHSEGEDSEPLHTGRSIVFDYFPRLTSTGYFHDMTRTWSIGFAAPEVQETYDQVLESFNIVADSLKVNDHGSVYQERVNQYFESKGHKTSRSHPGAMDGYVHSLGHGLGLNVHEAPSMGNYSIGPALTAGSVFTVEPGLYYPERDLGVRIEDTLYFDERGILHTLTDFRYDLILPLKGRSQ